MGVRSGRQAIVCAIVVVACATGERRSVDGTIAVHAQPACPPWHAKLDETLHRTLDRGSEERIGVIVRASSSTRRRQWRQALQDHGDVSRHDLAVVGAFGAQVHLDDVDVLASDPTVQSVSLDSVVGAHQGTPSPYVNPEIIRQTLGLNSGWAGTDIGVAVVDSGIEPSDDFKGRISAFYDFTRGGIATTPYDDYGHGTHVAGTIGGEGKLSNSNQFSGIASKARLIGFKVLDSQGRGRTSDVIAAVEFAILNKDKLGIDIINLSLGHPIYEPAATDPLVEVVEAAVRSGIIVVVSAGNYGADPVTGQVGYAGITSPGNAPSAITVGAVDTRGTVKRSDDLVATYSSRGPSWYDAWAKPDLVAPGHRIAADAARQGSLYRDFPALRVQATGWDYYRLSGTSMSSAVTSGIVAQMLEANRNTNGCIKWPDSLKDRNRAGCSIGPNAVKAILQYTALHMRGSGGMAPDVLTQGAGALNGGGAIELARVLDTRKATGAYWLNTPVARATTIGSETWPWGQALVWGNAVVWGNTLDYKHIAWGSALVWGNNTTWGKALVWGNTNPVWDDPASWGQALVWGNSSMISYADGSALVWGNMRGGNGEGVVWQSLPQSNASNTLALANPEMK